MGQSSSPSFEVSCLGAGKRFGEGEGEERGVCVCVCVQGVTDQTDRSDCGPRHNDGLV